MPAVRGTTTTSATPSYHISDANGNQVRIVQSGSNLRITIGGTSFQLTQQNAADLIAPLTTFANSGRLS